MNESDMQRGAREANEKSDRLAAARAIKSSAEASRAILTLVETLIKKHEALERRVKHLENRDVKALP